jgi:DNA-binding response OmpR family regulator
MNKLKLLYVEDDEDYCLILKETLELLGNYEIVIAENGQEGLEAYRNFSPDIVVSDVKMPVMSGFEMVKKIRKTDKTTPVIFASSKIEDSCIAEGYNIGIENYIKKPFSPYELHYYIKNHFGSRPSNTSDNHTTAYKIGKYLFNTDNHTLSNDKGQRNLTVKEVRVLKYLIENKGFTIKRSEMLNKIWGSDSEFQSHSLDTHLSNIRKYLAEDERITVKTIKKESILLNISR